MNEAKKVPADLEITLAFQYQTYDPQTEHVTFMVELQAKQTLTHLQLVIATNSGILVACGPPPLQDLSSRMRYQFDQLLAGETRNIILSASHFQLFETLLHVEFVYRISGNLRSGKTPPLKIPVGRTLGPINMAVKTQALRYLVLDAIKAKNPAKLRMYKQIIQQLPPGRFLELLLQQIGPL